MKTKKIYHTGIFVILFICLVTPLSYLIIGKHATGKIIGLDVQYWGRRSGSVRIIPEIEFQAKGIKTIFKGEECPTCHYGASIPVVYLSFAPDNAKIFSFGGLFGRRLIELSICLLIWIAFFSSFKTIFDKPGIFSKQKEMVMEVPVDKDLPDSIRYIFKSVLALFLIVLIGALVSIATVYSKKDIGWYGLIVVYTVIGMLIYLIVGQFKKI